MNISFSQYRKDVSYTKLRNVFILFCTLEIGISVNAFQNEQEIATRTGHS